MKLISTAGSSNSQINLCFLIRFLLCATYYLAWLFKCWTSFPLRQVVTFSVLINFLLAQLTTQLRLFQVSLLWKLWLGYNFFSFEQVAPCAICNLAFLFHFWTSFTFAQVAIFSVLIKFLLWPSFDTLVYADTCRSRVQPCERPGAHPNESGTIKYPPVWLFIQLSSSNGSGVRAWPSLTLYACTDTWRTRVQTRERPGTHPNESGTPKYPHFDPLHASLAQTVQELELDQVWHFTRVPTRGGHV